MNKLGVWYSRCLYSFWFYVLFMFHVFHLESFHGVMVTTLWTVGNFLRQGLQKCGLPERVHKGLKISVRDLTIITMWSLFEYTIIKDTEHVGKFKKRQHEEAPRRPHRRIKTWQAPGPGHIQGPQSPHQLRLWCSAWARARQARAVIHPWQAYTPMLTWESRIYTV